MEEPFGCFWLQLAKPTSHAIREPEVLPPHCMPRCPGSLMLLAGFRHRGLRKLYEDDNAEGVPVAMADKVGKLWLALETADAPSYFPAQNSKSA